MKKFIVVVGAALLGACATQSAEKEAVSYTVLREDVSLPFGASSVNSFLVGGDESLLFDGPGRQWYRAELDRYCQSLLPWEFTIGLDTGGIGTLDRFSHVIIDGYRCRILKLDEIADPRRSAAAKS